MILKTKRWKFIGKDSLGYKHGLVYTLDVDLPEGSSKVIINRSGDSQICPYDSWSLFRANWEAVPEEREQVNNTLSTGEELTSKTPISEEIELPVYGYSEPVMSTEDLRVWIIDLLSGYRPASSSGYMLYTEKEQIAFDIMTKFRPYLEKQNIERNALIEFSNWCFENDYQSALNKITNYLEEKGIK